LYIQQLFADAFITLAIGACAGGAAWWMGCPVDVCPFVGLAIGLSSYACRVSTEALMISITTIDAINNATTKGGRIDIDD